MGVSIIIPCYNHGHYLQDALDSIYAIRSPYSFEVIIVDDGSTDEATREILAALRNNGQRVLHQENKGLSGARNAGIRQAAGKYILPLDADNKLLAPILNEAVRYLEDHGEADIVYGNRQLFEGEAGIIRPGAFNLQKLMLGNYIDACALYRKSVWERLGGYDEGLRTGWEDWELWLHAGFRGFSFAYMDTPLFQYRVVGDSMVHQLNDKRRRYKRDDIIEYLAQKHAAHFGPQFIDEMILTKLRQQPVGYLSKMALMAWAPRLFQRLVGKGKLRKHL